MKKKFFNAKIYRNDTATEIVVDGGKIAEIGSSLEPCDEEIDLNGTPRSVRRRISHTARIFSNAKGDELLVSKFLHCHI